MKILWVIIAITLIAILGWAMFGTSQENDNGQKLTPAESFPDVHGIAVDPNDDSKLYIATHHGLFLLKDEKELFRAGKNIGDLMGFSMHPTDSKTFYVSGHPARGGNLGFQKTTNGGQSWEKISDGLNGPVDFHAMAVGQVDPKLVYGSYQGLQRSKDEGENWEMIKSPSQQILALATDPEVRERVYVATEDGLYVSSHKGDSWGRLYDKSVIHIVVDPSDNHLLVISTQDGMKRSTEGGRPNDKGSSWQDIATPADGENVMYMAYTKAGTKLYAVTDSFTIYSSDNDGDSWTKVRTN